MARKSTFAGLTILEDSDPITADGGSFLTRNPEITDRFLRIGAVTHRHNAAPPMANPSAAASATTATSGGALPADLTLSAVYTVTDEHGGETLPAPGVLITTPPPIAAPSSAPSAEVQYTGGTLPVGDYFYAVTLADAIGGETLVGPAVSVNRAPGFASGQVQLSGLSSLLEAGTTWRLFRAKDGGELKFLAAGSTDTYLDNGGACDTTQEPPFENTTRKANTVTITLPSAYPQGASGVRLYISDTDTFYSPSLFKELAASAAAGASVLVDTLNVLEGQPPDVSTSVGGANKIDPDTEILEWHWKRPVTASGDLPAGDLGDVRLVTSEMTPYGYNGSAWVKVGGAGGDGGGGASGTVYHVAASGSGAVAHPSAIMFVGSGRTRVAAAPNGPSAVVTVHSDLELADRERVQWPSAAVYGASAAGPIVASPKDTFSSDSIGDYSVISGDPIGSWSVSGGLLNFSGGNPSYLRWAKATNRGSKGTLRVRFSLGTSNQPMLLFHDADSGSTNTMNLRYDAGTGNVISLRFGGTSEVGSVAVSPDITEGWLEFERDGDVFKGRIYDADPDTNAPVATISHTSTRAGYMADDPLDGGVGTDIAGACSFDDLQWRASSPEYELRAALGEPERDYRVVNQYGRSDLAPNVGPVIHPAAIDFDGASVAASGASAIVTISGGGGSIKQVAASGDGSVLSPSAIMFVGSAGTVIDVSPGAGGSAIVNIAASAAKGDPGPSGAISLVRDEGVALEQRPELDFRGTTVAATDDPTNNRTIITVSGSSGGHTIQDENVSLAQRTKLDFAGAGVTATDDSANDKTLVTIPGGGSSKPWVPVFHDDFSVDRLVDDYQTATGVQVLNGKLKASAVNTGGKLTTKFEVCRLDNLIAEFKFVVGATAVDASTLYRLNIRLFDANHMYLCQYEPSPRNFTFYRLVGGTYTSLGSSLGVEAALAQGAERWIRLSAVANYLVAALYTSDPNVAPVEPLVSLSVNDDTHRRTKMGHHLPVGLELTEPSVAQDDWYVDDFKVWAA